MNEEINNNNEKGRSLLPVKLFIYISRQYKNIIYIVSYKYLFKYKYKLNFYYTFKRISLFLFYTSLLLFHFVYFELLFWFCSLINHKNKLNFLPYVFTYHVLNMKLSTYVFLLFLNMYKDL